MIDTFLLIAILAFAGVFLFILGVYLYAGHHKERRDLVQRVREAGEETQETEPEKPGLFPSIKGKIFKALGNLGRLAKPAQEGDPSYTRNRFLKAGIRKENASLIFFGSKAFLAILFALLFAVVKFSLLPALQPLHFIGLCTLSAMVGFYLPNLWLRVKIDRRKEKILLGLPDALDLMVVCAEAGVGLDAAINRVGDEMKLSNKTLSGEFNLMSLELRAGKARRDAFRDLAIRTDLEDVNNLASLLIQTERFGTSISQALRVHSDSMRVKRFQRAEEVAAKLPVKLLFPLIFFIFPSLFVAILGPAVIRIFRTLLPTLGGQ
jgi:tight adherence protein C